ncbi:MAG: chemotaxis protein CheB [Bacteroidota bacterium]
MARVDKDVKIESGNIYVLTENTALTIENDWLKVSARDEKIINSSVDIFFKSLATQFKERAIGIILSGGGSDGLEGALQLAESGGKVMVQNLRTAQVTGMPASIIDHDHPSDILNPTKLAEKVIHLCQARTDQTSLNDHDQKSIATPGG